jgi:3-phenylpropionate/trans-cinnamate dioxygenase ferredoxin reductase subunit
VEASIDLILGTTVDKLNLDSETVDLSDGRVLPYSYLAIATGGRPRHLRSPRGDLIQAPNVLYLRDLIDSKGIADAFREARNVVVIGGGYLGLEVAAAAVKAGLVTSVVESAPRLLSRVAPGPLAERVASMHRAAGVRLHLGANVSSFNRSEDGHVTAIVTSTVEGVQVIPAELIVVCVGLEPNTELASGAGLAVENGIQVDSRLRTSRQNVLAIGDCANFPSARYGRRLRLESVPNALEQGRFAAAALIGNDDEFDPVPWFWSDQYGTKLQSIGLGAGSDACVHRQEKGGEAMSCLELVAGRPLAAHAFNDPTAFLTLRKMMNSLVGGEFPSLGNEWVSEPPREPVVSLKTIN